MKLQRVEDLECWRESRILANLLFKKSLERAFRKDIQLRNHLVGGSLDVMNYMTEGFESRSDSEFAKCLKFSLRSISEVQTVLYAALDLKYIGKKEFMSFYDRIQKIRKLVESFRQYLSGRQGGRSGGGRFRGRGGNRGGRQGGAGGAYRGGGDRGQQHRERQDSHPRVEPISKPAEPSSQG